MCCNTKKKDLIILRTHTLMRTHNQWYWFAKMCSTIIGSFTITFFGAMYAADSAKLQWVCGGTGYFDLWSCGYCTPTYFIIGPRTYYMTWNIGPPHIIGSWYIKNNTTITLARFPSDMRTGWMHCLSITRPILSSSLSFWGWKKTNVS